MILYSKIILCAIIYIKHIKELIVGKDQIQDAINIANGVYAPLVGFLRKEDLQSVIDELRLADGSIWSMPIILDVSENEYKRLRSEKDILLIAKDNKSRAVLKNIECYTFEKKELAQKIYGTLDNNHPGVADVMKLGRYLVGGDVGSIEQDEKIFPEYNFTPAETKKIFNNRGWQTIVAFQTRNVPHFGHEFLQKYALSKVDGLFIQPVIGEKKIADFKDEYILSCYEILIEKYFPKNKVFLGILPLKMRYAGPREALMHALIRRNFGCTHFIVGRDHAGVGDYYAPTAAQDIFNKFAFSELGIKILKYGEVVYNKAAKKHCFAHECEERDKITFSGTTLREKIKARIQPPLYLMRSEVYNILINSKNSLVDDMYKNGKGHKGFVLWFTGLSCSGKTSTADRVYEELAKRKIKIERLDGDVVRENLTKDLGFSKKDRDENIRRVGFVAKLISRNGIGVLASFISPYRKQREELRLKIPNFIEVFVDTPLAVCEERDKKGLYKKARAGEIKNFTGISDPYEEPQNPEIRLDGSGNNINKRAREVIAYLEKHGYIK